MKADWEICPYPQRNILRVNLQNVGASLFRSLLNTEAPHFTCSSSCKGKASTKYPWLTVYVCKNENGPQFLCLCPGTQSRMALEWVMPMCLEGNKFVFDQCRASVCLCLSMQKCFKAKKSLSFIYHSFLFLYSSHHQPQGLSWREGWDPWFSHIWHPDY